ncbi:hypothetical protein JGS22_018805 [Streptomyces sp. P38-E01]|uniref:Lipoprotein n=1 Tax=Streptomyces tardus TaxID=2780544 RepID=A0A949N337_9ACTN|nr:hypothetical protein [Streptomyces tardus]MBU7599615.1 hypothetical protein [Streptomyces tardus]
MRRGTTVFALLTATALAAVGCASDDQTVQTGSQGGDKKNEQKDEQKDELTPFEKRASAILAKWPQKVAPAERSNALLPLEGVKPADSDSTSLKVNVGHGSCDADFGTHLQETGKVILVSGWAKEDKKADFCTEQVVSDEVTVKLKEKLGDREIIDAATGKPVKITEEGKGSHR